MIVHSEINNRDRMKQIKDFTGLRFGSIIPTDIDGFIEYHNDLFVIIETKYKDSQLKRGQELAFTRLCDCLMKPSILFITSHDIGDSEKDIDMAKTLVRKIYYRGEWIIPKTKDLQLYDAVNMFLSMKHDDIDTIIARAHERGTIIRRANIAQKRRGKMAKEKVRETANKAREAQG